MARRQLQLVTQHLENVSRRALEKYEKIIRRYVRRRFGIYALYRNNKLYYVGLASNLRARLARHLRDRHAGTWNRFGVYLTISDRHLKELESLAIRIARPKGNRTRGRFARSEDLKRQFRRAIMQSQRAEVDSIFNISAPERRETRGPLELRNKGVLTKYTNKSFRIRYPYKGKQFVARVVRGGMIRLDGKLYRTPSAAAYAATRRSVDGWLAWRYERGPGDWVRLDELRRR